jgi:hypothetical protein
MANKKNKKKTGEGTRKKLAAEAATAEQSAAFRAKEAAWLRKIRRQKKLSRQQQAAEQAAFDADPDQPLTQREKVIAKQVAEGFLDKAGHLSLARQGAILRAVIDQPALKQVREAAGVPECQGSCCSGLHC